jgi:predicted ATPase/DNA-binding CsgD family transcriptional regulator/Tfp pilus assembly protein PilF
MSFDHVTLKTFPRPQSSLVARAGETAEIHALLARPDVRMVTLTGPGGVGKTRLALHAALTISGFDEGRWFIELAGVSEPSLILPRIAQGLELRERAGVSLQDLLIEAIDGKEILLVLDNFEHLLDGAVVLSQLLAQVSGPKILTTSRSPLNLAREYIVPIGPLDLSKPADGAAQSEAVELFIQRSNAVRPGYRPSPAELQAIEAICVELSGIPLALELAAARTRIMSPQALLARLSQPLRLLASGPHDAPERHRSMRDAIEWSYRLLPDDQRALLRAMGVFAGSVPLDGIEAVAANAGIANQETTLELIERLVDASIIEPVETGDGDPRFLLFATVREFVVLEMERSGELDRLRDHHADWVEQLSRFHEPDALTKREHVAFARSRLELDNIRAALGWSLQQGNVTRAARIAGRLWAFWAFAGQVSEGRRWIDRILPLVPNGLLDPEDEWFLLQAAGMIAWSQGEPRLAGERHLQALAIARQSGNVVREANSIQWLSQAAWYEGDYGGMSDWARLALDLEKESPSDAAGAHDLLGIAAMRTGRLDEAERELEVALHLQSSNGLMRGVVWTLQLQADLWLERGDYARAARAHARSLPLALEGENHWAIFESLSGLMAIALRLGRMADALELLASAELLMTSAGVLAREGTWLSEDDRIRLKANLQPEDLRRLAEQAASLSLREIVERATQVADAYGSGGELPAVQRAGSRQDTPDFALSPREQDVLALMVQGMTDRQIADALFISHGTARTHVYHILKKVDGRNRAAAVRMALEHDLV